MEERRDSGIDLVKCFAIFGVLLIHCAPAGFSSNPVSSFPWMATLFWSSVSRGAVPLFFMCTGALFLGSDRMCSLRHIFTRSLPRMLAALFFWALVYLLYHVLMGQTPWSPVQILTDLATFQHESHFYYLHIALLVYLLLPLLRVFTAHASRRLLLYALGIWFLLGILYPTIRYFQPFSQVYGIPGQYALSMTWSAPGYVLLGYYLQRYPPQRTWLCPLLWGVGLVMVFLGTWFLSVRAETLRDTLMQGMSLPVAVMATGVFGTLTQLSVPDRLTKPLARLSQASFCVYLSHLLVLFTVSRLGFSTGVHPLWAIPLLAMGLLAVCYLLWLVLRLIPGVRRWLI